MAHALAGHMQQDLVEDRRWIRKQDYVEGLALAQLAPGPLAAQLAIYLGYVRNGIMGATAVAVAFVLPSFLMVLAFLPPHLHATAGVNLQANHAIGEFRSWVCIICNLQAVEMSDNVIASHRRLEITPLARLQCPLSLLRWNRHPAAPAAFIESAGMLFEVRVYFHLHPLDIRTPLRVDAEQSSRGKRRRCYQPPRP